MYSCISIDVQKSAPVVEGACALELWMLGCVIMVFAALGEYGLILFLTFRRGTQFASKYGRVNDSKGIENDDSWKSTDTNIFTRRAKVGHTRGFENHSKTTSRSMSTKYDTLAHELKLIDSVSLIIFPVVFGVFVIGYWFCFKQ